MRHILWRPTHGRRCGDDSTPIGEVCDCVTRVKVKEADSHCVRISSSRTYVAFSLRSFLPFTVKAQFSNLNVADLRKSGVNGFYTRVCFMRALARIRSKYFLHLNERSFFGIPFIFFTIFDKRVNYTRNLTSELITPIYLPRRHEDLNSHYEEQRNKSKIEISAL